jgi:hypothetical protein
MKFERKDRKWALVLLLGASLVVNACGDGDDDDDDGGGPGAPTRTNTQPAGQTRTPTATRTPGGADTPTRTPGGGNQAGLADVEAIISSILPTIATFAEFGNLAGGGAGGGGQIGGITVPCPSGGTLAPSCAGNELEISFNDCRIGIPGGPSTLIDGTFAIVTSGSCFSPSPTGTVTIDFAGRVETTSPLTNEAISLSFDLTITNTTLSSGVVQSDIDGTVDTACVGEVTIETREPIVTSLGSTCPTGGLVLVSTSEVEALVRYTSGGGLEIDLDADGSVDESLDSCLDAESGDC